MRSRRENQSLLSAARSNAVYTLMRVNKGPEWTGVVLSLEICNMARSVRCPSRETNLALGTSRSELQSCRQMGSERTPGDAANAHTAIRNYTRGTGSVCLFKDASFCAFTTCHHSQGSLH